MYFIRVHVLLILLILPKFAFSAVEPVEQKGSRFTKVPIGNSDVFLRHDPYLSKVDAKYFYDEVAGRGAFYAEFSEPAVIEGSLGQRSANTVAARVTQKFSKKAVLAGVATAGKAVAKRAIPFAGWGLLAYDIYSFLAESDGFTKGEDGDFYKEVNKDDKLYAVFSASESIHVAYFSTFSEYEDYSKRKKGFRELGFVTGTYSEAFKLAESDCATLSDPDYNNYKKRYFNQVNGCLKNAFILTGRYYSAVRIKN